MRAFKHITALLALLLLLSGTAFAQSVGKHVITTASTNASIVNANKTYLKALTAINTSGTAVGYLKLIDKKTSPTCGTDPVVWAVPVPFVASNAGAPVPIQVPDGLMFVNGLSICVTGALADNDTTSGPAGIVIDFGISTAVH